MKNMKIRILVFAVVLVAFITGCKKDAPTSLYDAPYDSGVQPTVTAISPENAPYALSGVTTLALSGSNFSTDISKMIVFFDATPGQILSATPTLIRVKSPSFYKDSVKVRVSIIGVDKFSETKFVDIKPSIINADSIDFEKSQAWSVAADGYGNIYVSLTASGSSIGIYKYTATGNKSLYAIAGKEPYFSTLKIGPGDTLFAARNTYALLYCDPFVLKQPLAYVTKATAPPMNNIDDFDFDAQKNIWGGGDLNTGIYRIDRNKQTREFPFSGVVRSVRVYNGALYVAANVLTATDTTEAVYKFPINADTLGTPVKYFDLGAQPGYQYNKIKAITFDASGKLYVGTDGAAGIFVVASQGASPVALYGGLIGPKVVTFQWGTGTILYVVRANDPASKTPQVLLKVDMQIKGAPYYGRGDK